jgi:hypothetical protein
VRRTVDLLAVLDAVGRGRAAAGSASRINGRGALTYVMAPFLKSPLLRPASFPVDECSVAIQRQNLEIS